MNQSLIQLQKISEKKCRTIIGLMSGTSLDGLDIALCQVCDSGEQTKVQMPHFITKSYDKMQKRRLRSVSSVESVRLEDLCYIHTWLASVHSEMIIEAMDEWGMAPSDVDCIASHGQTIYHFPARDQEKERDPVNTTFQIADGDQIAARTGIMTISDFRQKHTAHGGEGAPMAALVDRILFGHATESRILLNIGGIANYTYLPANGKTHSKSFTTDTGPGNTLIDTTVQHYFDQPYDRDGKIASSGRVIARVLEGLLNDGWFRDTDSKSTGPEYFNLNWVKRTLNQAGFDTGSMNPEDLVATITELSAVTISENIKNTISDLDRQNIYVSGGGAHNPVLMKRLTELLPGSDVQNLATLGFDPDAKEAIIFAVLANEMLAGEGFPFDTHSGPKNINFGKISFPD